MLFMPHLYDIIFNTDHPRYIEANTGCRHFDVHGGPENIPVSRFSFDAKVYIHYHYASMRFFMVCACIQLLHKYAGL